MNQKKRIFVSTYPFGTYNPHPIELLNQSGLEVIYNPLKRKLTSHEIFEFARNCDGLIAGTDNLHELIKESKRLKMIARVGIGLDSVPLKLCREKGIKVSYTPDAVTLAVSELVVGMMITLPRHVVFADRELRLGKWSRPVGMSIRSATIGIIGLGRVGFKVGMILSAFHPAKIYVFDILEKSEEICNLRRMGLNIEQVNLQSLLEKSDIISLHVPLTQVTKNLITKSELNFMKETAYLLNFSRGGIVNEEDIYNYLKNHRIAGFAVDVYEKEPYNGKLTELENVVLSQHMGSCSFDCRLAMETQATEEMIRFFKGAPLLSEVPNFEIDASDF
ncbi:phosphoglycerate dehydrogenase [Leptospira sp. WS60.C2]